MLKTTSELTHLLREIPYSITSVFHSDKELDAFVASMFCDAYKERAGDVIEWWDEETNAGVATAVHLGANCWRLFYKNDF